VSILNKDKKDPGPLLNSLKYHSWLKFQECIYHVERNTKIASILTKKCLLCSTWVIRYYK